MPRTKQETVQETTQEATQTPEESKSARKPRTPVAFVLSSPSEISAEVAADDDAPQARKGGGGRQARNMEDEVQAAFHSHVAISWENGDGKTGRMLAIKVPHEAVPEAVKRLRYAAGKAGLGLGLGNIREDPNDPSVTRIPFQARTRKVYKNKKGEEQES